MNTPTCILVALLVLASLFAGGCEEEEVWMADPVRYLETTTFPGYIERIPYFGVNGHSGLKPSEKPVHCSAYGVYVRSGTGGFLRTFNDSVLFHVPLKESLPYPSEGTILQVNGKTAHHGRLSLSELEVISAVGCVAPCEGVIRGYPKLMEKIGASVAHQGSKLDLASIETFHCAASGDRLLIFGRTYDLMYEFDLAFLFQIEDNSFHLKHIYAHHFFKGE